MTRKTLKSVLRKKVQNRNKALLQINHENHENLQKMGIRIRERSALRSRMAAIWDCFAWRVKFLMALQKTSTSTSTSRDAHRCTLTQAEMHKCIADTSPKTTICMSSTLRSFEASKNKNQDQT